MLFTILGAVISFIVGFEWCKTIKNYKELLNAKTWDEFNELLNQGLLEAKEINILVIVFRIIINLPIMLISAPTMSNHMSKLKRESK